MKFEHVGLPILLGAILALALGPTEFNFLAPGDQLNKVKMRTHLLDFDELFDEFDKLMKGVNKNRLTLLHRVGRYNRNPQLKKLLLQKQCESETS